tara:strand:- start:36315 stop:37253 length:939 start_codon:yes stop_codon:yes gene_type:complete
MKIDKKFILIIIGFIGLYAIFVISSDITQVYEKITEIKLEYLSLIFILLPISWFVLFAKWHILLRNSDIEISVKESLKIHFSSCALLVIPGKVGELIKIQILKTRCNVPRTKSAPIIIAEQLYNLVGIVAVSIAGLLVFDYSTIIIGASAIFLAFLFLILYSKNFFQKMVKIFGKIKFISKFSDSLLESHDVIRNSIRGKILFYASALSTIFWLLEASIVYIILLSLGINHLEILTVVTSYTSSILLGVASLLPMGIGVVEGSLTGFLSLHGVDISIGLTIVVIIRIFTRWIVVGIGFIALKATGFLSLKDS